MIPPWASSSLTCLCNLFLLLAATSWTPTSASHTRPLGVWTLRPQSPCCRADSLSILLPRPLKSCPVQVPVSVWRKPFRSPPAMESVLLWTPRRTLGLPYISALTAPSISVIWVLVLSLFQVVSLSARDCTWILKLQHLPQCLAYNRSSIQ